jgi:hypothetical protein
MRRIALSLLAGLLIAPLTRAAEPGAGDDVTACVEHNLPGPDSIRAVRFTSRDRTGAKTVTVVKMYGRRTEAGYRRLFVRFLEPKDVRGTGLLFLENPGGTEVYLASTELDSPRKITGSGRASNLFGTDFSYEDFARLEGIDLRDKIRRQPDEEIDGRPVYVVESRPTDSSYERIVSFVDQESCLPLRMRFYEPGGQLRKELTTEPRSNLKHGPVWVAHTALMRDLRDSTTTHLLVDSHEQDVLLPDGVFSVKALQDAVRAEVR